MILLFTKLIELLQHLPEAHEEQNVMTTTFKAATPTRILLLDPLYAYRLITYLLEHPITEHQQGHWLSKAIISAVPQLIEKIAHSGSDEVHSLIEYLIYNPLTTARKFSNWKSNHSSIA